MIVWLSIGQEPFPEKPLWWVDEHNVFIVGLKTTPPSAPADDFLEITQYGPLSLQ